MEGTLQPTYNLRPYLSFPFCDAACCGAHSLRDLLQAHIKSNIKQKKCVVCIECYPGVNEQRLIDEVVTLLNPQLLVRADEYSWSQERIEAEIAPCLTDDRVFGVMTHHQLEDFFDDDQRLAACELVASTTGLIVIIGVGASLLVHPDVLVYAEVTRREIELRWRAGQTNWKANNSDEDELRKIKRGYFFEWRIADRHKRTILPAIDVVIDENHAELVAVTGQAWREALLGFATRPFRLVPYFDESIWGGHWMQEHLGADPSARNLGWAFDGVPEENSIIMRFGTIEVEVPALDVVFAYPQKLLGERVYALFGAEFPIRFDFLDTWDGGNLSLQVHPLTDYARERFGIAYTQNESYYILDAKDDAKVYLGLKTGVTADELIAALKRLQDGDTACNIEDYVNVFSVVRHDHISIPAGTIHCSGANTVVLEISATPYIFTFKLWDWGRLGLDGKPRPINIDRGRHNIVETRTTDFCRTQLIDRMADDEAAQASVGQVNGHMTGLHELEFIETRRWWIHDALELTCNNSVNMLNVVQGGPVQVVPDSGSNQDDPLIVSFAETFIVPESVQSYRIVNLGSTPSAIIQAHIRCDWPTRTASFSVSET